MYEFTNLQAAELTYTYHQRAIVIFRDFERTLMYSVISNLYIFSLIFFAIETQSATCFFFIVNLKRSLMLSLQHQKFHSSNIQVCALLITVKYSVEDSRINHSMFQNLLVDA